MESGLGRVGQRPGGREGGREGRRPIRRFCQCQPTSVPARKNLSPSLAWQAGNTVINEKTYLKEPHSPMCSRQMDLFVSGTAWSASCDSSGGMYFCLEWETVHIIKDNKDKPSVNVGGLLSSLGFFDIPQVQWPSNNETLSKLLTINIK